jgi:hypothetical protein
LSCNCAVYFCVDFEFWISKVSCTFKPACQ